MAGAIVTGSQTKASASPPCSSSFTSVSVGRWDGQGQPLEQLEIDMHVEQVGLKASQAIGHPHQPLAQGVQILQAFVQPQILEPVDADIQSEEGREFFVHPRQEAFAVDAQHIVSMIELFQHAVQLAAHSLVFADAKDLGDLVGGEMKQFQLAGALEHFVDGEMPPEQEIAAVFDLVQRVLAAQGDGGAVLWATCRC